MYITLLKVKLRSFLHGLLNVDGSKGKRRFMAGLLIFLLLYLCVYMIGSVGFVLYGILNAVPSRELHWLYFSLTGLTAFSSSVILGMFSIPYQLYGGKDNELLLSMPIKPQTILCVRMTLPLGLDIIFSIVI